MLWVPIGKDIARCMRVFEWVIHCAGVALAQSRKMYVIASSKRRASSWPQVRERGLLGQVEGLKRFMPQLLHVRQPGVAAAGVGSPNVGSTNSLIDVFNDQ